MSDLLGLIAWGLLLAGVLLVWGAPIDHFTFSGAAGSACLVLAIHAARASGKREVLDD